MERTNPWLVNGVLASTINDFLGSCGRAGTKSVFERYDVRDSNGKFYSMNSHQFRHWVTTKAANAGVLDPVIAPWQGRKNVVEVGTYKHLTHYERLETLKAALKSGRVKGQIAEDIAAASQRQASRGKPSPREIEQRSIQKRFRAQDEEIVSMRRRCEALIERVCIAEGNAQWLGVILLNYGSR